MIALVVMAVCLALNALFSGIEMAFVSVGKPHLRNLAKKGNREAIRVLSLRDNPERTLSVLQVGITLVGVFAAAIGGAGAEESMSPWLESHLGLSEATAEALTILAVTIPYSFLTVVVGELVPKSIALRNPTRVILRVSRWLRIMDRTLSPIVTMLEVSTKLALRLLPLRARQESVVQVEEPLDLETLTQEHRQYVLNLFDIRRKTVWDVLIPWHQVVTADVALPASEVAALIHDCGHTRLPVVSEGRIVGMLNTKEFLVLRALGTEDWESIVRPIVKLRESDGLIRALRMMQEKRSHLSVVFAGSVPVGIVTMEDIFEEVIGDIYDEDDDGRLRRILVARRRDRFPQWARKEPAPSVRPGTPPLIRPQEKSDH